MSVPPFCHLRWDVSIEDIAKKTNSLIDFARSTYDRIGSIESPTFESVVLPLSLSEAFYDTERNSIDFPQHVFANLAIRDASCEATRKLSDVEVELEMRKDVFDKFVYLQGKLDPSVPSEYHRFVDKKVQIGRRNGLHLEESKRAQIEALNKEENQLCIDFQRVVNEENTLLEFTEEELAGCPDDFIQSLVKLPSGKRQISLKYPHYFPAMEKAQSPNTRKKLETAFNSRCISENTPILKRLMAIRKERSSLLGFPTHSDFMLDMRMAKNANNVNHFLTNIGTKLEKVREKEVKRLLELKKEECERLGLTFVAQLEPWDWRYYMNLSKEKDYSVDQQVLKHYFPLSIMKSGILKLYQHLLGLRFEKLSNPQVWHEEVEMYSVSDSDSGTLLGYIYLDLHPREGKYGHAAVFPLQPGCLRPCNESVDGEGEGKYERQVAIAAMVANFTAPTKEFNNEAYMLHEEVETFFHEFGHLMHHVCSHTDTSMFSGTRVETDFVECPSQMLENWVWCEEGLNALVGEKGIPVPKELLIRLIASRMANAGLFYSRQLLLASFDQAIHTSKWEDDPLKTFTELSEKWLQIKPTPGTFMPASFTHLAGGYDARYYSYLWSEVFSADLFESRFRFAPDGGCLSKSIGYQYREKILRPGGSQDAINMLKNFLGREPNDHAFFNLFKISS